MSAHGSESLVAISIGTYMFTIHRRPSDGRMYACVHVFVAHVTHTHAPRATFTHTHTPVPVSLRTALRVFALLVVPTCLHTATECLARPCQYVGDAVQGTLEPSLRILRRALSPAHMCTYVVSVSVCMQ